MCWNLLNLFCSLFVYVVGNSTVCYRIYGVWVGYLVVPWVGVPGGTNVRLTVAVIKR